MAESLHNNDNNNNIFLQSNQLPTECLAQGLTRQKYQEAKDLFKEHIQTDEQLGIWEDHREYQKPQRNETGD